MGWQPNYQDEAKVYAKHILQTKPDAKIAVLFQNDHWVFREVFELGQNSAEFVPEDPAAVDRLARRFASSLVASLLHRKTQ